MPSFVWVHFCTLQEHFCTVKAQDVLVCLTEGNQHMARKPKETPHLRLRVETTLLARLEKAAEKNSRTLTGEITHRLNESFAKEDMMQTLEDLADRIAAKVGGQVTVKEGERVIVQKGQPRDGTKS